jgi:Zn-dependent peptidase ImmA (M78 family)
MTAIHHHIRCLESYVERGGARVVRKPLPSAVHGGVAEDLITLDENLSPEQQLLTLVHEMAHWLAHQDAHAAGARATIYEYEAEAVEALVMARLGLPCPDEDCALEQPTDGLISSSLSRVLSTTRCICQALGLEHGA